MGQRIFLAISVIIWLPYGIYCFLQPDSLEAAAGLASTTPAGRTEIRAMYGGLQAALGGLALAAFFKAQWVRPALTAIAVLTGGLFLARLVGALMDGSFTTYTTGALIFELLSALAATWLLRSAEAKS